MKKMCLLLVVIAMLGVAGCSVASPVASPPLLYPSCLDGASNTPNSWHSAHVKSLGYNNFVLDDGTQIKLFFTGGTSPTFERGLVGTIYVSVPSYDGHDADNTYYFQKFVPDRPAK